MAFEKAHKTAPNRFKIMKWKWNQKGYLNDEKAIRSCLTLRQLQFTEFFFETVDF